MAEVVSLDLLINSANSAKNLGDLESGIEKLKEELKGADFGSAEFKKLSAALQDAQSKVKTLEKEFEGLEPQQIAESFVKVGEGIVGGFTAAIGAAQLFGSENEEIEQALVKTQSAIAIAMGARSIAEATVQGRIAARIVLEKASAIATGASAIAQNIWNAAIGQGSIQLKLFRGALIATGLGAIAVLIGLLIANWEDLSKWVKNNTDRIKEATQFFFKFITPVGLIIEGIEMLGKKFEFVQAIIDSVKKKTWDLFDFIVKALEEIGVLDTAEEDAAEANLERAEAQLESLEKLKRERERQIELAKAEGKTAQEIRDMEIAAIQERLIAYQSFVNAKIKASEDLSGDEKEKLKELQFELKKAQLDDERLTKEETDKKLKEEQDRQKKLADERKKAYEDRKKKAEEEAKRIADLERQLQDERIKAIADEREREITQTITEFDRKISEIKGQGQLETELRRQLEINKQRAIDEVNDKFEKDRAAKEAEKLQKAFSDKQAQLDAELIRLETDGQSTFDAQRKLENLRYNQELLTKNLSDSEIERLEAEHQQKLTAIDKAQEEERAKVQQQIGQAKLSIAENSVKSLGSLGDLFIKDEKKRAEFQKKVAVAQLAVDTAKSISATIAGASIAAAEGGPAAPFLLASYITSGIATVLGAFVQAKKLLSGSGSGGSPQLGSGSTAVSANAPALNDPTRGPRTQLVQNKAEKQVMNVDVTAQVVETDMTKTQNRVKKIEDSASFS